MNTSQDIPEQPAEQPAAQPAAPNAFHPPQPQSESAKFFHWLRQLGIQRNNSRWVGGVCSGLAEKWGIDPVIVRGLAVVLTLFFGVGLLAYGLAWALLPEPDGRIHAEEVAHGRWSAGMTGAGIATLLGLGGSGGGIFADGNNGWSLWPIIWIAPICWLIYWSVNRGKPKSQGKGPEQLSQGQSAPAQDPEVGQTAPVQQPCGGQPGQPWYGHMWQGPRAENDSWQSTEPLAPQPYASAFTPDPRQYVKHPPVKTTPVKTMPRLGAAASLLVIGAASVVGATVLLLAAGHVIDFGGYEASVAAAAAAVTAGLGIVAAGIAGRAAGGLGTFAVLALLFAGLLSLPSHDVSAFNNSSWAPATVRAAEAGRSVVLGNAAIDLTKFHAGTPLTEDVTVPLDLVASSVTIRVPANIPVQLKSELVAHNLTVDGKNMGGSMAENSTTEINPKATGNVLVINLQGAATNVDIVVVGAP